MLMRLFKALALLTLAIDPLTRFRLVSALPRDNEQDHDQNNNSLQRATPLTLNPEMAELPSDFSNVPSFFEMMQVNHNVNLNNAPEMGVSSTQQNALKTDTNNYTEQLNRFIHDINTQQNVDVASLKDFYHQVIFKFKRNIRTIDPAEITGAVLLQIEIVEAKIEKMVPANELKSYNQHMYYKFIVTKVCLHRKKSYLNLLVENMDNLFNPQIPIWQYQVMYDSTQEYRRYLMSAYFLKNNIMTNINTVKPSLAGCIGGEDDKYKREDWLVIAKKQQTEEVLLFVRKGLKDIFDDNSLIFHPAAHEKSQTYRDIFEIANKYVAGDYKPTTEKKDNATTSSNNTSVPNKTIAGSSDAMASNNATAGSGDTIAGNSASKPGDVTDEDDDTASSIADDGAPDYTSIRSSDAASEQDAAAMEVAVGTTSVFTFQYQRNNRPQFALFADWIDKVTSSGTVNLHAYKMLIVQYHEEVKRSFEKSINLKNPIYLKLEHIRNMLVHCWDMLVEKHQDQLPSVLMAAIINLIATKDGGFNEVLKPLAEISMDYFEIAGVVFPPRYTPQQAILKITRLIAEFKQTETVHKDDLFLQQLEKMGLLCEIGETLSYTRPHLKNIPADVTDALIGCRNFNYHNAQENALLLVKATEIILDNSTDSFSARIFAAGGMSCAVQNK